MVVVAARQRRLAPARCRSDAGERVAESRCEDPEERPRNGGQSVSVADGGIVPKNATVQAAPLHLVPRSSPTVFGAAFFNFYFFIHFSYFFFSCAFASTAFTVRLNYLVTVIRCRERPIRSGLEERPRGQ